MMINKANVITDGSADSNQIMKDVYPFDLVDFSIYENGVEIKEDDYFRINKKALVTSSCPSPHLYLEALQGSNESYIITMSSKLSGSNASAHLAKSIRQETEPKHFIHVFDSKSAASCESLIGMKIHQLLKSDMHKEELVSIVDEFIEQSNTLFVSESLENLTRNGRLNNLKLKVASILNLKFVMGANGCGEIKLYGYQRSSKKAYKMLIELVEEKTNVQLRNIATISHIDNLVKAEEIKEYLLKKLNYKEVMICEANPINRVYCGEKGIILSF